MNIAGLIIYLLITTYITVYVGKVLYSNGRPFLLRMLHEEAITDSVNRILLTGYYLVNLGYVSIMLTMTPPAQNTGELISALSIAIGRILLTLGIMHYLNIATVSLWNKMNTNKR
jgi:hypothetical protein